MFPVRLFFERSDALIPVRTKICLANIIQSLCRFCNRKPHPCPKASFWTSSGLSGHTLCIRRFRFCLGPVLYRRFQKRYPDDGKKLLLLQRPEGLISSLQGAKLTVQDCFSSSIFPHFRHSTSPLSSWEIPHFQQALSGYRFHNCVLPHKGMFHSVASSTSHQEMAVVSQSVNHGSGHLFIGEDAAPF